LLSGEQADWSIKKGALWWFSSRAIGESAQTALKAVVSPELL
jgi:phosphohistidine phosphatase